MAKIVRVTDSDIARAVRASGAGARSATMLRTGLEVVLRTRGSRLTVEYIDEALGSLVEYFVSSGEAARCVSFFESLYEEQQSASA